MTKRGKKYPICIALLLCFLQTAGIAMYGQDRPRAAARRIHQQVTDSIAPTDSSFINNTLQTLDSLREITNSPLSTDTIVPRDSLYSDSLYRVNKQIVDSIALVNQERLDELDSVPGLLVPPLETDSIPTVTIGEKWIPNPTKATWLALVFPGAGQIYNRKYWKLPIFYGGFAGCAYALTWNGNMYKDYMEAYKDAVNGNWNSSSITDLLPPNYTYSQSQLTETLRKRKDRFRRYRDLSIFAFIGVYILSVIDAYVDAELSNFDITPDIRVSVEPTVINSQMTGAQKNNVGLQCSFRF